MEQLSSKKLTKQVSNSTTQKFLDIEEIKESTIILKNRSYRAVLAVSSINYDLKSTTEQDAIVTQYQNFLNSLDFPVQILIKSRKINMNHYLEFLEVKEKAQENELLKLQTSEYKNFIKQLVSVSNIMDKDFYIIVPFSPIENEEKGFFKRMFDTFNPKSGIIEKRNIFETCKNQLFQRVDHIIAGLSGIGLRIAPLETQEIIELLYEAYNPTTYSPDKIAKTEELDIK